MKPLNKIFHSPVAGAVGMGLAWAAGCIFVGMPGVFIFYTLFPTVPDVVDIWIPVFAYPGFVGGVIFSMVLQIAESSRSLDQLPLSRIASWGVVAGLFLGVLPFIFGAPNNKIPLCLLIIGILTYTTLLCTISAVASALLFRYATSVQFSSNSGAKD